MEEINLYDLMRFYAKKWLVIASGAVIGAIIGIIFTFYVQQPLYKSSATILLVGTNRTSASQESVVTNNYVELFKSHRVLDPVIARQGYDGGFNSLVSNTTAQNAKNTDIINVSIGTSNAKTSQALLADAIQEFSKQAKELYGDNSVRISIVDAANEPRGASNIKPVQQIGLATVGGAVIAIVGLFFMYDYKNSQSVKKTRATTSDKSTAKKKKPATKK